MSAIQCGTIAYHATAAGAQGVDHIGCLDCKHAARLLKNELLKIHKEPALTTVQVPVYDKSECRRVLQDIQPHLPSRALAQFH